MAITLVVEVRVTVQNEQQAELIMDSVQSGLAENAIKDRVLYGGQQQTVQAQTAFASERKQIEASKSIQPVAVHTPKREIAAQGSKAPKERVRGVLGRSKLNRVGGS